MVEKKRERATRPVQCPKEVWNFLITSAELHHLLMTIITFEKSAFFIQSVFFERCARDVDSSAPSTASASLF